MAHAFRRQSWGPQTARAPYEQMDLETPDKPLRRARSPHTLTNYIVGVVAVVVLMFFVARFSSHPSTKQLDKVPYVGHLNTVEYVVLLLHDTTSEALS